MKQNSLITSKWGCSVSSKVFSATYSFPLLLYINIPQAMYKSRWLPLLVCSLRHGSDLVVTDLSSNLRDEETEAQGSFQSVISEVTPPAGWRGL